MNMSREWLSDASMSTPGGSPYSQGLWSCFISRKLKGTRLPLSNDTSNISSQECWLGPVILALGRCRLEYQELKVTFWVLLNSGIHGQLVINSRWKQIPCFLFSVRTEQMWSRTQPSRRFFTKHRAYEFCALLQKYSSVVCLFTAWQLQAPHIPSTFYPSPSQG